MSHLISPILPGSVSAYVKFDKPTGTSLPSTASADLACCNVHFVTKLVVASEHHQTSPRDLENTDEYC